MSRFYRILFGIAAALALWLLVEVLLRLGLGPPPPVDMVVRVSQCRIQAGGTGRLDCVPGDRDDLAIPARRPGRPRVVFLGGSSVRVTGGTTWVGFPEELAELLPEVEVLNLGVPGLGASNVALLASQLAPLQPDLVVIYSGHNDYNESVFRGAIRGTRLWMLPVYRLLARSWIHSMVAARPRGSPRRQAGGIILALDDTALRVRGDLDARFAMDLATAVRESPAPVLLCTLLRNPAYPPTGVWAPGHPGCEAAIHGISLPPSDPAGEARRVREACGEASLYWWLRSLAAERAGDASAADEAFRRSLDTDAVPLRAPAGVDDIIRRVAAGQGARLVDLDAALGLRPDPRFFVDTLHLSTEGARAVAEVLAPEVRQALGDGR